MVRLILKYLSAELRDHHTMACEKRACQLGELFRLDAKAEGDVVSIGGWRTKDTASTKEADWFSVQLTRSSAPWAFARGEPFRTIASLELLGALVGLVVLVPEGKSRGDQAATLSLSCGTDNRGNAYLLDRMLTTKYPLAIILMEMAHQMRRRRMVMRANWLPRDQNEEADALTNFDFRFFDPAKRIPVDVNNLGFEILPGLFEEGEIYVRELAEEKEKSKAKAGKKAEKKSRPGEKLRDLQPW